MLLVPIGTAVAFVLCHFDVTVQMSPNKRCVPRALSVNLKK